MKSTGTKGSGQGRMTVQSLTLKKKSQQSSETYKYLCPSCPYHYYNYAAVYKHVRSKHSEISYEKHSIKKQRLDTQETQPKERLSSTEALGNAGAFGSPQTAKLSNDACKSANVTPTRRDTKRLLTPSEQTGTPPGVLSPKPVSHSLQS